MSPSRRFVLDGISIVRRSLMPCSARTGRVRHAVLLAASVAALAACSAGVAPENRVAEETGPVVTASAAPSPLGNYLAAGHAQEVHDYGAAAQFVERALASDPDNFELVRRAFVLRISEGRVERRGAARAPHRRSRRQSRPRRGRAADRGHEGREFRWRRRPRQVALARRRAALCRAAARRVDRGGPPSSGAGAPGARRNGPLEGPRAAARSARGAARRLHRPRRRGAAGFRQARRRRAAADLPHRPGRRQFLRAPRPPRCGQAPLRKLHRRRRRDRHRPGRARAHRRGADPRPAHHLGAAGRRRGDVRPREPSRSARHHGCRARLCPPCARARARLRAGAAPRRRDPRRGGPHRGRARALSRRRSEVAARLVRAAPRRDRRGRARSHRSGRRRAAANGGGAAVLAVGAGRARRRAARQEPLR